MPRRVADPGRWRAVLPVRIPVPDTACGPTDTPDEPWTEALALTRGPRFDREPLGRLLGQGAGAAAWPAPLHAVAECFDALAPARQQRLHRRMLRAGGRRAMGESAAWTASC